MGWCFVVAPEDLLQQLSKDLRLLWTQAGGPSLRTLAVQVGLGKSQVSAIVNGRIRRPPDWEVVKNLIDSIRRYADDHGRQAELSLRTGINEYWRPRYTVLEHAFRQSPRGGTSAAKATTRTVPRQLPAGVPHFTGRSRELDALARLLDGPAGNSGIVAISAINGTAGVGKTALAVHWAHQVRARFPDGQLYVNLRGFGPAGSMVEPAAAIRGFLEALGVPPQRFPADLDALAALYRSELAGRRVLIVLDNARDSSQLRPLLPGTASCLVLATSRNRLSGLVSTHGAHVLALDLLDTGEARELLAHRLGPDRPLAEPRAAEAIIDRCARLPLALSIVAARAANDPRRPLHTLAAELSEADRLSVLTTDDPTADIRAVFSWSYTELSPDAARLFRLLGLHPGPDFTAPAAASLAALELPSTRTLLAELTQANLLMERRPDRYGFHDLLHAYALELAHAVDSAQLRQTAFQRMLDHYLHTSRAATRLLDTPLSSRTLPPVLDGVITQHLADGTNALRWYTSEHAVLLAVMKQAIAARLHHYVYHMACYLTPFLFPQGYWHDQASIQRAAIDAANQVGDVHGEASAHVNLANAYSRLDRKDDAYSHYQHGLRLATQIGFQAGQALIECNLSALLIMRGDYSTALEHARRAVDVYEALGERPGLGRALNFLAEVQTRLGDHQLALTNCHRSLNLLLEFDDTVGLSLTWQCMGLINHELGHHARALESYHHALDLHRESGSRYDEAETLATIGDTYAAMGDHGAAYEAWTKALTILDELRHPEAEQIRSKLSTPLAYSAPKGQNTLA